MEYPFVFISSMIRSGSTLLLELLTQLPYSYIFHEPALCNNKFNVKAKNLKDIADYDIDIHSILHPPILESFKEDVMPLLQNHIQQIGVKEVWSTNWENYVKVFPYIKIIITGRDPRDLYMSIYNWRNRNRNHKKPLSPKRIRLLKKQFECQKNMFEAGLALKVRYEDLCNNSKETITKIKTFINSPIPTTGKVGIVLSKFPKRQREYIEHKGVITNNSVNKWKSETNKNLVRWANDFFESIPDYCDFWGYKK